MVAVKAGFAEIRVPAPPVPVVTGEHVAQHQEEDPHVDDQVVDRPPALVAASPFADERETHQGDGRDIEALPAILPEKPLELPPALARGKVSPVMVGPAQPDGLVHVLHVVAGVAPPDTGPEDRVLPHHPGPRPLERGDVQILVEPAQYLLQVHPGSPGGQALDQQALLHRGERIRSLHDPQRPLADRHRFDDHGGRRRLNDAAAPSGPPRRGGRMLAVRGPRAPSAGRPTRGARRGGRSRSGGA